MTPRAATFAIFAVNGAMIGTWVAHIPWLQERLDVSKTTIGFALLCMAAGALVAMPLTGQVARPPLQRAGVTRVATLRLLPAAAAAADRAQPGRARRDPVRLRRGQRRDGRLDERARRRGRARPRPPDHVLAARRLEPRRLRVGRARGAGRRRRGSTRACSRSASASRCGWRRGGSRARLGDGLDALARAARLRAARARRDPDRRPVLPDDGHRGRDRRLERHLPAPGPRLERRRGGDRLHRLLARHGRRPARRRLAQRAPRRRPAAARRDVARRARARRRAADRRAGAGRDRLRAGRARDRQRRADPVQRRRPPRARRARRWPPCSPSATRASSSARR